MLMPKKLNMQTLSRWPVDMLPEIGHVSCLPPPPSQRQDDRVMSKKQSHRLTEARNFVQNMVLECPRCGSLRGASTIAPMDCTTNKWTRIACLNKQCKASLFSNKWFCTCHKPWQGCHTHSSWPQFHEIAKGFKDLPGVPVLRHTEGPGRTSQPGIGTSALGTKRPPPQQAQAEPSLSFLSKAPRLAARFSHLVKNPG